jgi:hypothetical protein
MKQSAISTQQSALSQCPLGAAFQSMSEIGRTIYRRWLNADC